MAMTASRSKRRTVRGSAAAALTTFCLTIAAVLALSLLPAPSSAAAAKGAAAAAPPPPPPPGAAGEQERFTEELLLRPLPSGHLLALFHFESSAPGARAHHARFPRAAAQLLAAAPSARRVELSLAAGRWRAGEWGAAPFEAKPGAPSCARPLTCRARSSTT